MAAKFNNLKVTKKEVSQRFNLQKIFDLDFRKHQGLKEAIGQAIIDKIVKRTKGAKNNEGKGFAKYSKEYKDSDDYKAHGKTGKVNITLTGDMLGLMDITAETPQTIKIGWDEHTENGKAHGHMKGRPGKKGKRGLPARPFFGLSNDDVVKVKSQFKSEISEAKKELLKGDEKALEGLGLKILKGLTDGR